MLTFSGFCFGVISQLSIVSEQRKVSYEIRSTTTGVATNLGTPYDYSESPL